MHEVLDLEVEVEGENDPLLAREPVSEYPDQQEGEMVQSVVVDCTLPVLPLVGNLG